METTPGSSRANFPPHPGGADFDDPLCSAAMGYFASWASISFRFFVILVEASTSR